MTKEISQMSDEQLIDQLVIAISNVCKMPRSDHSRMAQLKAEVLRRLKARDTQTAR